MTTRHAVIDSVLGELTMVAADDALIGVYFRHPWHRPSADALGLRVGAEPYGQTITYGELAAALAEAPPHRRSGRPSAATR